MDYIIPRYFPFCNSVWLLIFLCNLPSVICLNQVPPQCTPDTFDLFFITCFFENIVLLCYFNRFLLNITFSTFFLLSLWNFFKNFRVHRKHLSCPYCICFFIILTFCQYWLINCILYDQHKKISVFILQLHRKVHRHTCRPTYILFCRAWGTLFNLLQISTIQLNKCIYDKTFDFQLGGS